MSKQFAVTGDTYRIVLDASFDLYQAGEPNDDDAQEEFAAAYREAAAELADELGISIRVIDGNYSGPAMQEQTENGDEGELWQEIHNRTVRS